MAAPTTCHLPFQNEYKTLNTTRHADWQLYKCLFGCYENGTLPPPKENKSVNFCLDVLAAAMLLGSQKHLHHPEHYAQVKEHWKYGHK